MAGRIHRALSHRTVALKLFNVGVDTRSVVARFESERQALALMEHPNIAKVFDAGAMPEGRPYFVMEYVPGLLSPRIATSIASRSRSVWLYSCRCMRACGTLWPTPLVRQGRYSEADKLRVQVLAVRRRVLGPEHPDTRGAIGALGVTQTYEKQYAKVDGSFQEAIQKATQSSDKSQMATAWYHVACGEAVRGHRDAAFEYFGKAADLGSGDVAVMAIEEDLMSLRGDPR